MVKLHQIDDEQVVQTFFDHYYKDRGMVKWQGFFLSDHIAALRHQREKEAYEDKLLPQMTQEDIGEMLEESWKYKRRIHIQINSVSASKLEPEEIDCVVKGHEQERIYIKTVDGLDQYVELDEIRFAKVVE